MGMVADMILTVAVVAVTAGAIPEFQIRVGDICSAAYGAAVMVGRCGFCGGSLIGTCTVKINGLLLIGNFRFPFKKSGKIDLPGYWNYVAHILAEEQEVVSKGNQGEQIVGK